MMTHFPARKETVIYTGPCIRCSDLISYEEGTAWVECPYCQARFETKYIQNPSKTIRSEETTVNAKPLTEEEIKLVKGYLSEHADERFVTADAMAKLQQTATSIETKVDILMSLIRERLPLLPPAKPRQVDSYVPNRLNVVKPTSTPKYPSADWKKVKQFAGAGEKIVGVTDKGRVVLSDLLMEKHAATVQAWTNVSAVAFDGETILGLAKNGNVYRTKSGANADDYDSLYNLIAIVATANLTVGVERGGQIKAFWKKKRVNIADGLSGVRAVALSEQNDMIALLVGGFVKCVNFQGKTAIDVSEWQGIVQVAAGSDFVAGVTKQGRVLCAARNSHRVPDTGSWKKIKQIVASADFVVGLTDKGDVLSVALDSQNCPDTSSWHDVKEIIVCNRAVIGVKKTGERLQTDEII